MDTLGTVLISGAILVVGVLAIVAVAYVLRLVNTNANTGKAEWDLAREVIVNLVLAAQQMAKNGQLPDLGPSKRQWVVQQAELILAKYKVNIELDGIAAILEAVYVQYIGSVIGDLIEDEQNDGDDEVKPPPTS